MIDSSSWDSRNVYTWGKEEERENTEKQGKRNKVYGNGMTKYLFLERKS